MVAPPEGPEPPERKRKDTGNGIKKTAVVMIAAGMTTPQTGDSETTNKITTFVCTSIVRTRPERRYRDGVGGRRTRDESAAPLPPDSLSALCKAAVVLPEVTKSLNRRTSGDTSASSASG